MIDDQDEPCCCGHFPDAHYRKGAIGTCGPCRICGPMGCDHFHAVGEGHAFFVGVLCALFLSSILVGLGYLAYLVWKHS